MTLGVPVKSTVLVYILRLRRKGEESLGNTDLERDFPSPGSAPGLQRWALLGPFLALPLEDTEKMVP